MLGWPAIVAVLVGLVLVMAVDRLIVRWRSRREIADLKNEVSVLNDRISALNVRVQNVGRGSLVPLGLFLAALALAVSVLALVFPLGNNGTSSQPSKEIEIGTNNDSHGQAQQSAYQQPPEQQQQQPQQQVALSPRQERWKTRVAGALQQLRAIMENLRLRFNEVTTATTTATPREKPIVREPRPYYLCCCPPNYYYRHYDYYR